MRSFPLPSINQIRAIVLMPFLAIAICASYSRADVTPKRNGKSLVSVGAGGKLIYAPANSRGDTIPDFSNVGYKGGGVALPDAPVRVTVAPDGDGKDDLARLQAALDQVAALPFDDRGMRGALLVKKGRYLLSDTLQIRASGVVLRGEGQGENDTVLVATKRQKYSLIETRGQGAIAEIQNTRQQIIDDYVPVGARSFRVESAAKFKVGDEIIVQRPSTVEWISVLGMDKITPDKPGLVQWKPGSKDLKYERTITTIVGDKITIDAPLVNALQKEFGGGFIYKTEFPGRIENVGVENLRGESEFDDSIRDKSEKRPVRRRKSRLGLRQIDGYTRRLGAKCDESLFRLFMREYRRQRAQRDSERLPLASAGQQCRGRAALFV